MMAKKIERFTDFDAADYLRDEEDMIAYLEAAIDEAEEDPTIVAAALGDIARAHGMAELSRSTGLGRESLYKALSKDGNPTLGTVLKVLRALGLKLTASAAAQRTAKDRPVSRARAR